MIYIIEATIDGQKRFKIGTTSRCPWSRLDELQRQSPAPLELVAGLIGDRRDEQALHHAFRDFRLHGEWFREGDGISLLVSDFPISEWDRTYYEYETGEIHFGEVYQRLTPAKFVVS